jgi:HAMP domain-containing protein
MDRIRSTNPRRLILFTVLLLVLSIALFYWMRQVVNEVFVIPISYLIYLGGIFVIITPQIFFWLAILLLTFWIAFRSLNRKQKLEDLGREYHSKVVDDTPYNPGRLRFWAVKVNVLQEYRSSYFIGGFHQSLSRLVIELLAHRHRLTITQVEDRVRAAEIDLPAEIQEYLQFCLGRQEINPMTRLERLWQDVVNRIAAWLHLPPPLLNEQTPAARAYRLVDRVIEFMEDELEVSHEHPSQ